MIEVRGKYGVYARVLKHSISPAGVNLLTFEVSYPRIILAELNTHGMICKNSSSSRAIPFEKMQASLTGRPIRFGANQAGMQDKGEEYQAKVQLEDGYAEMTNSYAWNQAKLQATEWSRAFYQAGYHKQVYNRLTEPFQMMKTVLTATEYANFFWLRDHDAADPSLQELAHCMHEAAKMSTPDLLQPGDWHLPYVDSNPTASGWVYHISDEDMSDLRILTLDEAIKVSSARCAAVSFRNVDYGVEKSAEVFAKLTSDLRIHGSAFQHQATPCRPFHYHRSLSPYVHEHVNNPADPSTWEEGITHADRDGQLWSAQLAGWIMHRKLIPGENKPGFLLEESQC